MLEEKKILEEIIVIFIFINFMGLLRQFEKEHFSQPKSNYATGSFENNRDRMQ